MVKICPNCQKENIDKNKFCEYCGSNLPQVIEEKSDGTSVIENSKDIVKENVNSIKDKLEETTTKEKVSRNKKKIEQQEEMISKNKEILAKQNAHISQSKKVNNDKLYNLKYKLFYWNDKKNNEFVFSKTKTISISIFVFFFIWYNLTPVNPGLISRIFIGIMISLIFSVPAFVIGYIIHYLQNR